MPNSLSRLSTASSSRGDGGPPPSERFEEFLAWPVTLNIPAYHILYMYNCIKIDRYILHIIVSCIFRCHIDNAKRRCPERQCVTVIFLCFTAFLSAEGMTKYPHSSQDSSYAKQSGGRHLLPHGQRDLHKK